MVLLACGLLSSACTPEQPPTSARIQDSPCGYNFEYERLEPLPREYHGIVPTHAVRAQVYACVGNDVAHTWEPIGGIAAVKIEAVTIDPRVQGEVVKAGAGAPWPYENIAARLGFNFPIAIEPGIEVGISAHFTVIIDAGEMVSCWLVEPDGHTVIGSRFYTVQTQRNTHTSVDCGGFVGETA